MVLRWVATLAAAASHEINSPLETIHNFAEYLKHKVHNTEARRVLAHIDEEVTSISQIISNLISFSESECKEATVFDVNELIEHILSLVRFGAGGKKISISFGRSREALYVKASQSEIKQVILNLLKNSFDAMPAGGETSISTSSQATDGRGDRYVEIIVQDTGTGIPRESVSDVFLPFFTTKSSQKHMGLGLSISYGIIRKYKGEISVSNLPERGCRFRITIPRAVNPLLSVPLAR